MDPRIVTACVDHLHNFFEGLDLSMDSRITLLKLLEVASLIEMDDEDDLPPLVLKRFKNMTHLQAQLVVKLRNNEPLLSISLPQERYIYKLLISIYNQKD